MALSEMQQAVQMLRQGPCTAEKVALKVYGSDGSYALGNVYAIIYRLRKRGINIVSGNDGVNMQQAVYILHEEDNMALTKRPQIIISCTECNEGIVFEHNDYKAIMTTQTFTQFIYDHIMEAIVMRGEDLDKSKLFVVTTEWH